MSVSEPDDDDLFEPPTPDLAIEVETDWSALLDPPDDLGGLLDPAGADLLEGPLHDVDLDGLEDHH